MEKEKWYKKSFRRNLVDMHIDAWDDEFLSQFDAHDYFDCLKIANISSPMIYTHSHVGYTNWPSKSGEMHPGFNGERKIEELFELCNSDGMDVIAYYSLIYNNWAYNTYPSWRMVNINGDPSRGVVSDETGDLMMQGRGRYGLVCPNNNEYREFLKLQFAELNDHFSFKAIFLDMTFWPMICYCDSCRERYIRETGKSIPEFIDWSDPLWLEFQKRREEWMTEFSHYATTEMKKVCPGVDVEHQFSTATHPWTYGVVGSQAGSSDYTGGDLYGGFEQQSFICKLYYDITKNQPFEYMTSRCDPGLFDHTTTKSIEMLKLHAYLTYAHHGAFLAIDAIDPCGSLNHMFYNSLGEVFNETKVYETFFKGNLNADIALYFSFSSKMDFRSNERTKAKALVDQTEPYQHIACILGAAKALRRNHIPYRVINDQRLKSLYEYKVIVLTDIVFMNQEEEDALFEYVQKGGRLYISGITSKRLLSRLLNIEVLGMTKENVTYISPKSNALSYFEVMYTQDYPMTVFGPQVLVEDKGNNSVLSTVTLPYTDPKDLSKFASIHSNPPGIKTSYPSIIHGLSGKGEVLWVSAPIESSEQLVHKKVFINFINMLNPIIQLRSSAPDQIEFTIFYDVVSNVIQLHCINLQEHFPLIKIPSFSVSMRCPKLVNQVKHLPNGKSIPFTMDNDYVTINVEVFEIFSMYEFSLK